MNPLVKRYFFRFSAWAGLIFVLLFVFRLLYGYMASQDAAIPGEGTNSRDFFSNVVNLRKNYASEKMAVSPAPSPAGFSNTNQKYEKTASIQTKSDKFDNDSRQLKQSVSSFKAIIQYEQAEGLRGERSLHLMIGVTPESFDSFYTAVSKIGNIRSNVMTKVDKTNEYRQLNARKTSLENTLKSLNDLKSQGGTLADKVALHDKIIELENNLQDLGVELGNFNAENEFCTVKVSLYEGQPVIKKEISVVHRVKVALQWTITWYLYLAMAIAFASLAILFMLLIVSGGKNIALFNKPPEK